MTRFGQRIGVQDIFGAMKTYAALFRYGKAQSSKESKFEQVFVV